MSEEIGIILREAVPDDAKDILSMMEQVNSETEFLALDEAELLLPPETLSEELSYMYESNNNLLLLAINEGTIVGTASVKADSQFRLSHVGEVGISIKFVMKEPYTFTRKWVSKSKRSCLEGQEQI